MVRMSPTFRQSLAWLLGLAGSISAQAQSGLTTESPFLPAGAPAGAATENAVLEFRGVMVTSQGPVFLIVDPTNSTKKGVWVKLNETGRDFSVKNYDTQSDTVAVDYRGRLLPLSLAKSKVGSSGVPMLPMAGTTPGGQPPIAGPISPVVLNPTQADETRRLEAVTQEVLRRRQLRQQAAAAPGGPQVPPSPSPMQPASQPRPPGSPPPGQGVQVR
jgi:hypothetical protein